MDNRLKAIRESTGKRQEDVANDLCISLSTYRSWEQGKRQLNGHKLGFLADYFNVTVDDILGSQFAHQTVPMESLNEQEVELVTMFRALNTTGKKNLLDHLDTLIKSGKYERKGGDRKGE